jgi:hypothetical protein
MRREGEGGVGGYHEGSGRVGREGQIECPACVYSRDIVSLPICVCYVLLHSLLSGLTTYSYMHAFQSSSRGSHRPRVGVMECGSPAGLSDADALIVDLNWINLNITPYPSYSTPRNQAITMPGLTTAQVSYEHQALMAQLTNRCLSYQLPMCMYYHQQTSSL